MYSRHHQAPAPPACRRRSSGRVNARRGAAQLPGRCTRGADAALLVARRRLAARQWRHRRAPLPRTASAARYLTRWLTSGSVRQTSALGGTADALLDAAAYSTRSSSVMGAPLFSPRCRDCPGPSATASMARPALSLSLVYGSSQLGPPARAGPRRAGLAANGFRRMFCDACPL